MILFPAHSTIGKYYAKRYHLRYVHAKKLFVFDLLLLGAIFLLIGATIAWLTYDPTVRHAVVLTMASTDERLQSGDLTQITISYQNKSSMLLRDTLLTAQLPNGFILRTASAPIISSSTPLTFFIGDMKTQAQGNITLSGQYFATPKKQTAVLAHLIYNQSTRKAREEKTATLFLTVQDTPLAMALEAPDYAVIGGSTPIILTLTNRGNVPLDNITVPITNLMPGLQLSDLVIDRGNLTQDTWKILQLPPQTTTSLRATAVISSEQESNRASDLIFTANIAVNDSIVPQATARHHFSLLAPHIDIGTDWSGRQTARPGERLTLAMHIKNNSDQPLTPKSIRIPLPEAMIDSNSLPMASVHNSVYEIMLPASDATIAPGNTKDIAIPMTLLKIPAGGTDISLKLSTTVRLALTALPGVTLTVITRTPALPIGSSLIAQASLRYYTADGDQLGRGPLPPRVGKQTRYWATFTIKNTTSEMREVTLSGELASDALWTGKTSVSMGNNVRYDEATRTFHWYLEALDAHDSVNINFEIGFTPTENERGSVVPLIKNISVQGRDSYIDTLVKTSFTALDTSLPEDLKAQTPGLAVQ